MNERSETPFFPVPVRWFEIPMNTARWGFMHPSQTAGADRGRGPVEAVTGVSGTEVSVDNPEAAGASQRVGRLLNVLA